MKLIKKINSIIKENNYYRLLTNSIEIRIWILTDDIIRIRAGFDEDFAEESYNLLLTSWYDRMDDLLEKERKKIDTAYSSMENNDKEAIIRGKKLLIKINKNPFYLSVYDEDGALLHRDVEDLGFYEDNNLRRVHTSEINESDNFYGFGEKTGKIDKSTTRMSMNPKDTMGYDPIHQDSLYKHIPFYIKLNENNQKAVGYYYHNNFLSDFDMGREHSNYWHKKSQYRTDGGDIDLFLISGPKIRDIIQRYTDLTGKSAMLPKYSLGYLGSSMYYSELDNDADDAIENFVERSGNENIPIDGFQLSSGYSNIEIDNQMSRSVFNWNYDRFKNPAQFFENMNSMGVTVSPNIKPGILLNNPLYEEMKNKKMFIVDSETNNPGIGAWWGGKGSYIDFTKKSVRNDWKEYLEENILEKGTTSVWNDNCEYDGLFDDDLVVDFEGKPTTLAKTRTSMANLMCLTTKEAIEEVNEEERPFIVCRSGNSGIQRYAQSWSGDNYTSWNSLKYNVATILGMGMSGVSNYGSDIGGFAGPAPSSELFVRWIQNGIFQPRFSIHSSNSDNTVTEPWMYREYTELIRKAIQFRYQLVPYFYSLMDRAHRTGIPMMESLVSAFQEDRMVYKEGINFMLGDGLFVANVVNKGERNKEIYFPKDEVFYDFNTRQAYTGGQTYEYPVDLETIPLFIKGGAIIPIALNKISNLKFDSVQNLKLICAPVNDGTFELYEDDGRTTKYQEGDYLRTKITMVTDDKILFNFQKEGNYDTSVQSIHLDVILPEKSPFKVIIDGKEISQYLYDKQFNEVNVGWYYNQMKKSVQIKYPNITTKDYSVEIDMEENDLLGM